MERIVLLAVAAVWAAVLIPPMLRSRGDSRPNSSVTDFRRQLSTLQRAVPTRTMVPMRSMGRPLAPAAQQRTTAGRQGPAASGQRMHSATLERRRPDAAPTSHRQTQMSRVSQREIVRRRRANVLFMLVLANGVSLFLAATTKSEAMVYVFALAFVSLCGYCYKLVQIRNMEQNRQYDTWFNAA